jgi:hypothetical protein
MVYIPHVASSLEVFREKLFVHLRNLIVKEAITSKMNSQMCVEIHEFDLCLEVKDGKFFCRFVYINKHGRWKDFFSKWR